MGWWSVRRAGPVLIALACGACANGPAADLLSEGGTLVTLEVASSDSAQVEAVAQAARDRLEALEVPFDVTSDGGRVTARVVTDDSSRVEALLSGDGALQAALVEEIHADGAVAAGDCEDVGLVCGPEGDVAYTLGPRIDLHPLAEVSLREGTARGTVVEVAMTDEVESEWRALTAEAACRRDAGQNDQVAVVVGGQVVAAPSMAVGVECGRGVAGGHISLSVEDPEGLAAVFRGAYPVSVSVVEVTGAEPAS